MMQSTRPCSWTPCGATTFERLEGRYVVLEKMDFQRHYAGLFQLYTVPDAAQRMGFLFDSHPATREKFEPHLKWMVGSNDPEYYAIVDKASGLVSGHLAFKRIDYANRAVAIGSVNFGPRLARKPGGTEAVYLAACHVLDTLHFRRFEWRSYTDNEASCRAAVRLGFTFEGVLRQSFVHKDASKDVTYHSIINDEHDWPLVVRQAMEMWLREENFDADGKQRRRLTDIRDELREKYK